MATPETKEAPAIVEHEHLIYLDALRESGETNMFGAGAYLQAHFGFDKHEARDVLGYWMDTFSDRHPPEDG